MAQSSSKILLIDTDKSLLSSVSGALKEEGYEVIVCNSTKQAFVLAKEEVPDLIISEISMPEMDGIELCVELRKLKELEESFIIFVTLRNEEYSQLAAFKAGADDYIIKPVRNRVLVSRIKALLKHHSNYKLADGTAVAKGLIIDREQYLIYKDGEKIILPKKEFELLSLLASSPHKVFSRIEIAKLIWGYEILPTNRTLDVHIRKIREKLGEGYIKTVKGIGYKMEV